MTGKPELYSYWRSSCSWRVRTALALKGIKYEYKTVNLLKGEQLGDEHSKLNPKKEVPVFVFGDVALNDSVAIIEYLDEVYPDPPILPRKDPISRAKVRGISSIISAGMQPIQNLSVGKYIAAVTRMDIKMEMNKHVITAGFQALEQSLEQTAGRYCYGDDITLIDLCLVPQVYSANRYQVDMTAFPIISRINGSLSLHPAFIESHPDNQPDCPNKPA